MLWHVANLIRNAWLHKLVCKVPVHHPITNFVIEWDLRSIYVLRVHNILVYFSLTNFVKKGYVKKIGFCRILEVRDDIRNSWLHKPVCSWHHLWLPLIKGALSRYLLSFWKVKRVFASIKFQKQGSGFVISDYIRY